MGKRCGHRKVLRTYQAAIVGVDGTSIRKPSTALSTEGRRDGKREEQQQVRPSRLHPGGFIWRIHPFPITWCAQSATGRDRRNRWARDLEEMPTGAGEQDEDHDYWQAREAVWASLGDEEAYAKKMAERRIGTTRRARCTRPNRKHRRSWKVLLQHRTNPTGRRRFPNEM